MNAKRILLVDDETSFTGPIKEEFVDLGYEVKEANLGAGVPGIVAQWQPALVLLDVMMPDMSGDEVAEKIRSNAQTRNTPIVFITALETKSEQSAHNGKIAGEYIMAKPTSFAEIMSFVKTNSLI